MSLTLRLVSGLINELFLYYREESQPIGDGPRTNPTGTADVSTNIGGFDYQYSIQGQEIPFNNVLRSTPSSIN